MICFCRVKLINERLSFSKVKFVKRKLIKLFIVGCSSKSEKIMNLKLVLVRDIVEKCLIRLFIKIVLFLEKRDKILSVSLIYSDDVVEIWLVRIIERREKRLLYVVVFKK